MNTLAQVLTRRLTIIAAVVVALNIAIVGSYYGLDQRALETEALVHEIERLHAALDGTSIPADAAVRALYADQPEAYAFALVDRSGIVLDSMNGALIPPFSSGIYADDWLIRLGTPARPLLVAGQEFPRREDGLRAVFVMTSDPEDLLWHAFLREFYVHVALPILPMAVVLIIASAVFLRRGLAPVADAAAWARDMRPGTSVPLPSITHAPAEIADLVNATQRALTRLDTALAAEKRNAAEAAHALRTPLAVLVARLDALPPGETTDRLRDDMSSLSRMVQQVLGASRTDAVEVSDGTVVNLSKIAETVTANLAPFAYTKGAELSLLLPQAPVTANADAEGATLALSNLIENAILHGGPGLVEISAGPGPTLRVRDHGPGLAPGVKGQMFKPFWRAPDAVPGGAGLGLAIVARLQRAQGGQITVLSPEDGGTDFLLTYLPVKN